MSSYPKKEPIKLNNYTSKQSKYAQCAKLPMRSIVLGPSGSGKTILLQNMILDIYDGCFDKIYIFSPSVNLDHTWVPVKEYIKDKLKIKDDDTEDPIYYDEYNSEYLLKIIETNENYKLYEKNKRKLKCLTCWSSLMISRIIQVLVAIVSYYMLYILVVDMLFYQQ